MITCPIRYEIALFKTEQFAACARVCIRGFEHTRNAPNGDDLSAPAACITDTAAAAICRLTCPAGSARRATNPLPPARSCARRRRSRRC